MTAPGNTSPEERAANSSLGELLGEVSRDFSTLIRQEVELAKVELRESATRAGRGAGLLGGAGVAGHMALLFLTIGIWWGLGDLIESNGWSAVIIAVVYAIVALVLFLRGKKEVKSVQGLPKTAETVGKIPPTLKP